MVTSRRNESAAIENSIDKHEMQFIDANDCGIHVHMKWIKPSNKQIISFGNDQFCSCHQLTIFYFYFFMSM